MALRHPSQRDTATPAPGPMSRFAAWMPVGGAFFASLLLHFAILAAIASLLLESGTPLAPASLRTTLSALLVAAPANASAEIAPLRPPERHASRTIAPEPPAPAPPVPAPWAVVPVDTSAPPSFAGRARLAEGVEIVQTRDFALLGEDIERRVLRAFPDEPDLPVRLKPVSAIGYPIDALAAGIEGRVLVWFGVDEDGRVIDRDALDGPQELRDWVLERLDQFVDKPARTLDDRPARGWVALEIYFTRETAEEARMRVAAEAAGRPGAK